MDTWKLRSVITVARDLLRRLWSLHTITGIWTLWKVYCIYYYHV